MDKALTYELDKIKEIRDNIYPTNAPQDKKAPYLVYFLADYRPLKTIDGTSGNIEVTYYINIFCNSYFQLADLTKKVRNQILTFPLRTIGTKGIYVQDLTINNIANTYEDELGLYRSIIDFKISYKEE